MFKRMVGGRNRTAIEQQQQRANHESELVTPQRLYTGGDGGLPTREEGIVTLI
jgi:hypothetical protein